MVVDDGFIDIIDELRKNNNHYKSEVEQLLTYPRADLEKAKVIFGVIQDLCNEHDVELTHYKFERMPEMDIESEGIKAYHINRSVAKKGEYLWYNYKGINITELINI